MRRELIVLPGRLDSGSPFRSVMTVPESFSVGTKLTFLLMPSKKNSALASFSEFKEGEGT